MSRRFLILDKTTKICQSTITFRVCNKEEAVQQELTWRNFLPKLFIAVTVYTGIRLYHWYYGIEWVDPLKETQEGA